MYLFINKINMDPNRLERQTTVCSLDIRRVQSARLHGSGLQEEEDLRHGIQSQIENTPNPATKRVISFEPGDPENPHNWSMVSCVACTFGYRKLTTSPRVGNGSSR